MSYYYSSENPFSDGSGKDRVILRGDTGWALSITYSEHHRDLFRRPGSMPEVFTHRECAQAVYDHSIGNVRAKGFDMEIVEVDCAWPEVKKKENS